MKELKQPWINWHSQAAAIRDTALAPTDPLRNEPIWTQRSAAEDFEMEVARAGIRRWSDSRFERLRKNGRLERLPEFMRQVLTTTTVNLTSSPTSNAKLPTAAMVPLPITFFLNTDALVELLGLEPDIHVPQVSGAVYRAMLPRFDVAVTDGKHRFPGETNFVFLTPEPAFEDIVVLEGLLNEQILSPKLATSLLMIDFCNPIFSSRRAALLQYIPDSAALQNPADLESQLLARLQPVATAGSPEEELLANLSLGANAWKSEFEQRIERFSKQYSLA